MELPRARRLLAALVFTFISTQEAGAAIGRTPGTARVTADGEAAYSIPIAVPPGTNGMTPALSLEYRHRVEGGLLGVGWTLAGLSQIARCPRTIAHDGPLEPELRQWRNRFCFDGQRLVVVNGVAYGETGAEYRTEIESYARIRQLSGPSPGPQSFVVETRDGRILEYGATADSRIDRSASSAATYSAAVWALNRIRDRSGNVIDFEYLEDTTNLSFRLVNVRYNSNPGAGIASSHRIAFVYETRPSNEVDISYVMGTPIRFVTRLDRIDVFHGTTLLRRYDLTYQPALSPSGKSRLASVQECGRGGADCLAPTTFSWQNGTAGFAAPSVVAASIPASTLAGHQLLNTADLNGDGHDDLVYAGGTSIASATIRYRLFDGVALGAEVDSGIGSARGIGMPFDYNGDGRADMLFIGADGRWRIAPGTASGIGATVATGITVPAGMVDYRGLDMNADGLGDIAWSEVTEGGPNFLEVRALVATTPGAYGGEPRTLYAQSPELGFVQPLGGRFFARPGAHVDFNVDGGSDLILDEYATMTKISDSAHATLQTDGDHWGGTPFDMNGDGCTDYAYRHYTNRIRIRVAECALYWAHTELLGPAWSGPRDLRAIDWNGDGRDDLLLTGATNWQVSISNGDSFGPIVDTGIAHEGTSIAQALDADGDGLDDFVMRSGGQIRLRLHSGPRPDLLLGATDGFGVTVQFSYRPLTDPLVYRRGPDAAWPEQAVESPELVVAEIRRTDGSGTGALAATQYFYDGLRRNLHGRGSLGFARRTTTGTQDGQPLVMEEVLRQDYPYTGLPASVAVRLGAGQPFSETTYDWSSVTLGSDAGVRRLPFAIGTTQVRREISGTYAGVEIARVTRAIAAIDAASGTATDETTTIRETASGVNAGASANIRVLQSALTNDVANWCLGRPGMVQVTASHTQSGGDPITRTASQTWDSQKCRLTQYRREPGSSQWQVTIGLAYDAFGNLANRSVTGVGMAARATTVNWGTRGQLPASVTNPLQQSVAMSWDLADGMPLSITDPNGLRVSWSYDVLGRLTQESRPDGTSTTWLRTVCASNCDVRARYQLLQRDRDTAAATQITTIVDADQHDRAFRTAVTRPGGATAVQRVEADAHGREWRRYAPFWSGGTSPGYWQFAYDALDRITGFSLHSAGGSILATHTLRHDGLGVTHVDALNRSTTGTLTAWGSPAQVADPAGGVTRYEYNAFGGLLRMHDGLGNLVASASYDANGGLATQTEMNSGTWVHTRNALGELVGLRDAKSQNFTFAYDALGRLTSRTSPEGSATLAWGASASARNIGRIAGISGPGYAEAYAYDGAGRLATRTITSDASYQYDFAYDSFGLPASLTYPTTGIGSRFKIAFDHSAGELIRVRDANSSATFWQANAWDAAGNALDESLGTSARVVTGYDPVVGTVDYRRTTAGTATIRDLDYEWDASGNLALRRDLRQGLVEEFRYDTLDRLDDARRNGAIDLDLQYDSAGNIRWKSDVCPTASPCYSYDPVRKHAVSAVAGQGFAYDANGNMTNRAGAAVTWTSGNQPASISGSGSSSQFWYGPAGNRWKQVANQAGTTETIVYAGELMEKVVRDGATAWRHYVPAPGGAAAVHLRYGSGATAATRFLTRDHLGGVDGILAENGSPVASWGYAPFGRRRGANGTGVPSPTDLAAIGAVTRDGFTGHEHLDHLGLIHMGGRVYDPHVGRFLSADPHVTAPFNSQSLNRYSYVWNNPLSLVDPSGFDPQPTVSCMTNDAGKCATVTVIGAEWGELMRTLFRGGAGAAQVASAAERDPCGQGGSGLACMLLARKFDSGPKIVLSVGTKPDSSLSHGSDLDRLQGFAARVGNLLISAAPVTWLFGADLDFEYFDIPNNAAGRSGATIGNVGYLIGGAAGIVRGGGARLASGSASRFAQSLQGTRKYPGVDRFRDITLREGTLLFSGHPGQTAFYTTLSAMRRSGTSAEFLYDGLQLARSNRFPLRSEMAIYEVIKDTPAAFGLAIQNAKHGSGWLPQVVVPSYESVLRYLGTVRLGP